MLAQSFGDGFGFGMDLQFFVDVAEVERDCVEGDAHHVGGGLFVMAFDQQLQKLAFLRRQIVGCSYGFSSRAYSQPPLVVTRTFMQGRLGTHRFQRAGFRSRLISFQSAACRSRTLEAMRTQGRPRTLEAMRTQGQARRRALLHRQSSGFSQSLALTGLFSM